MSPLIFLHELERQVTRHGFESSVARGGPAASGNHAVDSRYAEELHKIPPANRLLHLENSWWYYTPKRATASPVWFQIPHTSNNAGPQCFPSRELVSDGSIEYKQFTVHIEHTYIIIDIHLEA